MVMPQIRWPDSPFVQRIFSAPPFPALEQRQEALFCVNVTDNSSCGIESQWRTPLIEPPIACTSARRHRPTTCAVSDVLAVVLEGVLVVLGA